MSEITAPRDVETVIHENLPATLATLGASVPVITRLPASLPARFIQVVLDGGTRRDRITDSQTVTVRGWGRDKVDSRTLAGLAYAALMAMPDQTSTDALIRRAVSIGGPAWLPDPETNRPRYQATVSLDLRPEIASA